MSTTRSVGADIIPRFDTVTGKVACLCKHKFVHSGNKNHRKLNWWPAEGLGESLQECGLIHLKLRSWADSDLSECLCRWHFPSLTGVPAGTQPLWGDGAFWGRKQCSKAWGWGWGGFWRQGLIDSPCFQGTLIGRQNLYCQHIQQSHGQSQPKEVKRDR